MKYIYVDYTGSVSLGNKKFHGGSYFSKNLIVSLMKSVSNEPDVELNVFWPDGYEPHDEYEKQIVDSDLIKKNTIKNLSEVEELGSDSIIVIPLISIKKWNVFETIKNNNPGCKLCVTIHGLRVDDLKYDAYDKYYGITSVKNYVNGAMNTVKKAYLRSLCKKYLPFADKIFTVSNFTMQSILKICTVNNIKPYYEGVFEPSPWTERKTNEDFILCVSANRSEKNFLRGLEAFIKYKRNTSDDIFLYATGVNDNFKRTIENLYSKDAVIIKKWVRMFDYVDNIVLETYYNECLFLLYPSKSEGFGLPILEMALRGKTAVASGITSIPEVVGAGVYYIDPYNVESIYQGLLYMTKQENLNMYENFVKGLRPEIITKIALNKEMLIFDILNW